MYPVASASMSIASGKTVNPSSKSFVLSRVYFDPFTEAQIQEGLATVMEGRTAIIIAHRLSTVRHADRIIVLDRGRILEEGTHEGLLEDGGTYAQLYNTYFRHQSMEYIEQPLKE